MKRRKDTVYAPRETARTQRLKEVIRAEFKLLEERAGDNTVMASWLRNSKGRILAIIDEGKCTMCMKCFDTKDNSCCRNPGE